MYKQWKKLAFIIAALLLVGVFLNTSLEAVQFIGFANAAASRIENQKAISDSREGEASLTSTLTPTKMTALPSQKQQTTREDSVQNNTMLRVKAGSSARLKMALFLILLVYILQLFAADERIRIKRKFPSHFWRQIIHYIHAQDGEKDNTAYFIGFATN